MDLRQSPFSLYDLIGYMVPGAFFIVAGDYFLRLNSIHVGFFDLSSIAGADKILIFMLFSYVLGHLIGLVSSFSVERFYIWMFGYPSKTILRYEIEEMYEVLEGGRVSTLNVAKMVCEIFLMPISIVSRLICGLAPGRPGFVQELDPLLTEIISRKITRLLHEKGQIKNPNHLAGPRSSDFFRFVYHYAVENCPAHSGKMQNYVALFGLNRAMALIFCLMFWVSLISFFATLSRVSFLLVVGCALISSLFFFGFAKFYRRYSLEALMAMAVGYQMSPEVAGMTFERVSPEKRKKIRTPRKRRSAFDYLFRRRGGGR